MSEHDRTSEHCRVDCRCREPERMAEAQVATLRAQRDDAIGVAARAEAQVATLTGELAEFHAECEKVGIPHDAPGLVRHHRGNAALAGAAEAMVDTLAAEARAASLQAAVDRAKALADKCEAHVEGASFNGVTTVRQWWVPIPDLRAALAVPVAAVPPMEH